MAWPRCKKFLATDPNQWAMVPLRIALGIIFIGHGSQKLFGWWGGHGLAGTAALFAGKFGLTPGWLWAALAGGGRVRRRAAADTRTFYAVGRLLYLHGDVGGDL